MVDLAWRREKTNLKQLTEYVYAHLFLKYVHAYNVYV